MGNTASNDIKNRNFILKRLFPNKEIRILMLGLDNAGKTTILYKIKMGKVVRTIPTIGFNVETLCWKNLNFSVWDIGGQDKIRSLWRHYFYNVQGLIYVIDSNDRERIDAARDELHSLLDENDIKDCKILVFANKQDLPNSMRLQEISSKLNLHQLPSTRKWFIQSSCALSGDGLEDGVTWLGNVLRGK